MLGCPIRKSSDQVLCANPRSLSQLIASFFASESLGIRHTPLLSLLYFLLFCSFTLFYIARLLLKNYFFLVNFLSFTISLFQYVNELVRIVADKYVSVTILAAFDCIKVLRCGEYRSRTDDLLRARQAL
jgi:nitrate/nitrite transporter NarK